VRTLTQFRPKILSRHPSHDILRTNLPYFVFRSVVRLGSTTTLDDGRSRIEVNSVQGVNNSANKFLMKLCFTRAGVKTADWYRYDKTQAGPNKFIQYTSNPEVGNVSRNLSELPYPIIAKHLKGSRGTGNYLLNSKEDFEKWGTNKDTDNYIFEKYYTYNREYRLHVTEDGCFYGIRKLLKSDTPVEKRFQRHDDNCVWYTDENPKFDKPSNWDTIVDNCVKALKGLGLDIACFDVKVQSTVDKRGNKRKSPEFIIIESGSAPSFGTITAQKYLEQIARLLEKKYDINSKHTS
jgi:hypothetical protein